MLVIASRIIWPISFGRSNLKPILLFSSQWSPASRRFSPPLLSTVCYCFALYVSRDEPPLFVSAYSDYTRPGQPTDAIMIWTADATSADDDVVCEYLVKAYDQCGENGYEGPACCVDGHECVEVAEGYSQVKLNICDCLMVHRRDDTDYNKLRNLHVLDTTTRSSIVGGSATF